MRSVVPALAAVFLAAANTYAQTDNESGREWSLSASVYTYLLPDDVNYAQPTISSDVEWFHVEGRYNYEALHTGSVWAGVNTGGGEKITWEFTPMLGGIFGDLSGAAAGYKGSLGWGKLSLYSEGEFVFDSGESSDSFFYNWSEITYAPSDWFRTGIVAQRTRVYQTERDIQRGVLVGLTFKNFDAATYVFNPDDSAPIVVLSVTWTLAR